jgi:hypothetical protein
LYTTGTVGLSKLNKEFGDLTLLKNKYFSYGAKSAEFLEN